MLLSATLLPHEVHAIDEYAPITLSNDVFMIVTVGP